MSDDSTHILKRKMATAGRDPGPLHLIADLSRRMGAEAAGAFTEFFGEKCQLAEARAPVFAALGEALTPFASVSGIYHFRHISGQDFVLVLDVETSLRAAGWSLSASRDLPDPAPESVSAIDRRLAKRLAIRSAELIFEKCDKTAMLKGGVELIASGDDPRRFDFTADDQKVVCASYDIQTLEAEGLGTVRVFAAEKLTLAMRDYHDKAVPLAAQKWKRDLMKLAAMSPVMMRTSLTEQDIPLGLLMELKPGQVIDLTTATIDDVKVRPLFQTSSKLELTGALGNRDGVRALKIASIDY